MSGAHNWYEAAFWLLVAVCAVAVLAWIVNCADRGDQADDAAERAQAAQADEPVHYAVTPAGEQAITWGRGGSIDVDLAPFREHRNIWPVRVRVGRPGCRGIPCLWFADGSESPCGAHDPRMRDAWKQWESEMRKP